MPDCQLLFLARVAIRPNAIRIQDGFSSSGGIRSNIQQECIIQTFLVKGRLDLPLPVSVLH